MKHACYMSVENDCNICLTCMLPCACYCLLDACNMHVTCTLFRIGKCFNQVCSVSVCQPLRNALIKAAFSVSGCQPLYLIGVFFDLVYFVSSVLTFTSESHSMFENHTRSLFYVLESTVESLWGDLDVSDTNTKVYRDGPTIFMIFTFFSSGLKRASCYMRAVMN